MLDRNYQLELLKLFNDVYPSAYETINFDDDDRYLPTICYLKEHGLVNIDIRQSLDGQFMLSYPTITAKGMDFLADDGGLSAILGTVTVKFHEETLRQLIADKVQASELPVESKKRVNLELQKLPAEAIKHLTLELLSKGLEQTPALLHIIGKFVGL